MTPPNKRRPPAEAAPPAPDTTREVTPPFKPAGPPPPLRPAAADISFPPASPFPKKEEEPPQAKPATARTAPPPIGGLPPDTDILDAPWPVSVQEPVPHRPPNPQSTSATVPPLPWFVPGWSAEAPPSDVEVGIRRTSQIVSSALFHALILAALGTTMWLAASGIGWQHLYDATEAALGMHDPDRGRAVALVPLDGLSGGAGAPLPAQTLADLVEALDAASAQVIVVDTAIQADHEGWIRLQLASSAHGAVLLADALTATTFPTAPTVRAPILAGAVGSGAGRVDTSPIFGTPDLRLVLGVPLLETADRVDPEPASLDRPQGVRPSLVLLGAALQSARRAGNATTVSDIEDWVQRNCANVQAHPCAMALGHAKPIPLHTPVPLVTRTRAPQVLPSVHASQVLAFIEERRRARERGEPSPPVPLSLQKAFAGRVAVIGSLTSERYVTGRSLPLLQERDLSGVEVRALALEQVLTGRVPTELRGSFGAVLAIVVLAVLLWSTRVLGATQHAVVWIAALAVFPIAGQVTYTLTGGLTLPLTPALCATIVGLLVVQALRVPTTSDR